MIGSQGQQRAPRKGSRPHDRCAQLTHTYGSCETEVRLHCNNDITGNAASRSTQSGVQGDDAHHERGPNLAPREGSRLHGSAERANAMCTSMSRTENTSPSNAQRPHQRAWYSQTQISPLQLCKAAATREYGNPSNQVMEASPPHHTAARKPIMNVQYSFNIKTGFTDLKCLKRGSQQRVSRAKGYCVYQEE